MGFADTLVPSVGRRLSRLMAAPSSAQPDTHFAGLDAYQRLGGNSIYLHGEGGETHSREATGRWLTEHRLRTEFFLCTQVCHDDWDDTNNRPVDRFTSAGIAEDVAKDLDLIRVERIDLISLGDNPNSPFEPVIDAISREIKAGRVGAYGLRSWSAKRIRLAVDFVNRAGIYPPAAVFTTELSLPRAISPLWPEYIPFSRAVEELVLETRLAVFAHVEDFNIGQSLFGAEEIPAPLRSKWVTRWHHPDNAALVQRVEAFAVHRGLTPREVNLGWVLQRPFPVVGIISLPILLTDRSVQYERASKMVFGDNELEALRAG
jgi:aryl-alcohol dehydrogenase-like predicted oxidoreductase